MSLVDRFVCRREGHKPAVRLKETSGLVLDSYITTCIRCGKHLACNPDGTVRKRPA